MAHSAVAARALGEALEPFRGLMAERKAEQLGRYALDPFAHLEDGHIKILDLESLQEVTLDPWGHQREVLEGWMDLPYLRETGVLRCRNLHEEKSRQMGITWIFAYACWWMLTYHALPGLMLHRNGTEVDDGGQASTTDSFVGKIRFIHERVPERFRAPLTWRSRPTIIRNAARPNAYLVGEGATPDPGRGGRYGYVLLDEAARIPWAESVQASVRSACPTGRAYNSTPEGKDNLYYRMKAEGGADMVYLRHHWSIHPVYAEGAHVAGELAGDCPRCDGVRDAQAHDRVAENGRVRTWDPKNLDLTHRYAGRLVSPWYDRAVVGLTDEQVAQELDIDYTGALTARVYPEFHMEVHVQPEGIEITEAVPPELAFDYGADTTSVIVFQDFPGALHVVAELEAGDSTPEAVSAALRYVLVERGWSEKEVRPEYTRFWLAIGDPAGEGRDVGTGRPLVADYSTQGFQIVSSRQPVYRTINAVRRLLGGVPKRIVVDGQACPLFIEHIENNRWPVDRQGRRKLNVTQPENDRHNHMMRALAYYVSHKWPAPEVQESLRDTEPKTNASGRLDEGITSGMRL